jgi:hypothetical protein
MTTTSLHTLADPVPGTRILARVGTACAIALTPTLSACGGDDDQGTIPQAEGNAILDQLETVQEQVDAGECDAAEETAQQVQAAIDGIGQDVSDELEEALVSASGNLTALTRTQCEEPDDPPEPTDDPSGTTGAEGVSEGEG